MRALNHAVIASILAAFGGFFLLNTDQAKWSCGSNVATHLLSCGQVVGYQFLTLGALFSVVAALETLMGLRRRLTGATSWETDSQKMTRRVGNLTLLVGAIISTFSLYESYAFSFYVGAFIAVAGEALVLVAAFMGVKLENWRKQAFFTETPTPSAS